MTSASSVSLSRAIPTSENTASSVAFGLRSKCSRLTSAREEATWGGSDGENDCIC